MTSIRKEDEPLFDALLASVQQDLDQLKSLRQTGHTSDWHTGFRCGVAHALRLASDLIDQERKRDKIICGLPLRIRNTLEEQLSNL